MRPDVATPGPVSSPSTPATPGATAPAADDSATTREVLARAAALDADPPTFERYLARYYRHVPRADLAERDPADLYGAARSHWSLAEQRPEGRVKIRVFTPTVEEHGWSTRHTVVEIVTDDMPFLVDSVLAEVGRHDIGLHLVVHPQLVVRRSILGELRELLPDADPDAPPDETLVESWMHVEIDRQSDADEITRLAADLQRVLTDVREAVEDWRRMRARALALAAELDRSAHDGRVLPVPPEEVHETGDLLRWLADDHFTFLGYREYELASDDGEDVLRAVPGSGLGILRADKPEARRLSQLAPEARARVREPRLLVVTKANSRSTVHRPAYLDYVGVKRFDEHGNVVGERRFLGLLASAAYLESVRTLPVVRRKVERVLALSGHSPRSHDGKNLLTVLETYPRDELFQISGDELYRTVSGVLTLQERRQLRLFVRRDDYGRFVSCLVYLPRDRWNTRVRLRIEQILLRELHGVAVDYTTRVTESVLARLHFVVRTDPNTVLDIDVGDIQAKLVEATRSWDDDLLDALAAQCGEERAPALRRKWSGAFPEAYKEDFPARTAVVELLHLEQVEPGDIALNLYRPVGAVEGERRLKVYRVGGPLSLSDVLPVLQAMGLRVVDERPYELRLERGNAWIYDFGLRQEVRGAAVEHLREKVQDAIVAAWRGESEVDGFNALVLAAGVDWPQATVLRAYAKYLRQIGTVYSQVYIEQTLVAHAEITTLLVELFETRFDPARGDDDVARAERTERLVADIRRRLEDVDSLDQDRILRSLLGLILATLRTSAYQRDAAGRRKPYLALKVDPVAIADMPRPRPRFEVFVYGPRVEGVHLRFGAVARGGLRWSDRREDFRTEVLGLVKAQMVKNVVIVPVGAKGGFVVNRPPAAGDRDTLMAEGIACYRMFVSALLDVTDNLVVVGGARRVVPPPDVVRHDGDDPYLVVAADKGTATFSDLANEVAAGHGFWLGDAFASGGSAGYDHKGMGITARGAWESVKRHFRELGVDTQSDDFTVVGVGDMSGDVFGNGMLLSPHIRLVAAFDHRHVFLDPTPDAAASHAERQRLFALPRSSWDDYDRTLISEGGGVWPRTAKSVPVSAPLRAALGIEDETVTRLTPVELIRAVLTAPVDLLWNGGIGTYVKASDESHAAVGDKANDGVRVDGRDLRARVVGEGGNLGLTQRGRIEYALSGGRVNTDAIDNSAGVDTSDHEVNIKILLDRVVAAGDLTRKQRDGLLASMTDEVAAHVLRDNYDQNTALGNARRQSAAMLTVHSRLMRDLERQGRLDRAIEFLPDDVALEERTAASLGLTSPELSVLLAYVKIALEDELLGTGLPDEPWATRLLAAYFPEPLRDRFAVEITAHPLRRELVTTVLVNDLVNHGGSTYVYRAAEETGASAVEVARAYAVADQVFGMAGFRRRVEALDNRVPTLVQTDLNLEQRRLLDRTTRWLLQGRHAPLDVTAEVEHLRPGVLELMPRIQDLLIGSEQSRLRTRADAFADLGVPADLALDAAGLLDAFSLLDVVQVAARRGVPAVEAAQVYFTLSEHFAIDWLLGRISLLPRDDRWHALARSALRYDLYAALSALTGDVLDTTPAGPAVERVAVWEEQSAATISRVRTTLGQLGEEGAYDLATLSVVLRQIRTLVRSGGPEVAPG